MSWDTGLVADSYPSFQSHSLILLQGLHPCDLHYQRRQRQAILIPRRHIRPALLLLRLSSRPIMLICMIIVLMTGPSCTPETGLSKTRWLSKRTTDIFKLLAAVGSAVNHDALACLDGSSSRNLTAIIHAIGQRLRLDGVPEARISKGARIGVMRISRRWRFWSTYSKQAAPLAANPCILLPGPSRPRVYYSKQDLVLRMYNGTQCWRDRYKETEQAPHTQIVYARTDYGEDN